MDVTIDASLADRLGPHETALWSTDDATLVDADTVTGWPVQLVVTDRRLLAVSPRLGEQSWVYDHMVDLHHSPTDATTTLTEEGEEPVTIAVPMAAVPVFRATLRDLFDFASQTAEAIGDTSVSPHHTAEGATTRPAAHSDGPPPRRAVTTILGTGDRIFHGVSWAGGLSVLVIMTLVGLFLSARGFTALHAMGFKFVTTSAWEPDSRNFGIAAVLTFTILIALVALVVAVPLSVGTALFISEVAPRRLKQTFVSMVDLMAAVPSIVYGLWGFYFLQGHVLGLARWISTWFGWIPFFRVDNADPRNPLASPTVYSSSTFIAGMVVALMVIPISCSIMREVFSQAPSGEREGAFALGSTRWGMIRSVVLPFGRGGMIGAVMLGLGRALGETIAVYLIISPVFKPSFHVLQNGSNSVAALIALRVGDASGFGLAALMAAGLALFALTLIVNFTAAAVVAKSRSGAESDA